MRKLILIGALVLFAATAFAQTAPATNYEIYGSANFDYMMTGTEWSMQTVPYGNFTFSRLRVGLRAQLGDGVKSSFEFDPRNVEFRQAYIDWVAMENLTLTIGKTNTLFEQISWYGAARMYVVGAKYAMPGTGWIGLQVGNKSDITFTSGSYLGYPTLSTAPGATVAIAYKQDPWAYVFPAIVFKPDLGKDITIEVGAEGQLVPQQIGAPSPTGASIDGYFTVAGFGLTFTNEFTWMNLNNSDSTKQELTYYAQLTYNAGVVSPTVYFVTDVMKDFDNNPNSAIGFELPILVAKNLKINPMFSYAIANYNAFQGNNATVSGLYQKNDWAVGIRFDYSYSIKF
jgi:hypothetical protein